MHVIARLLVIFAPVQSLYRNSLSKYDIFVWIKVLLYIFVNRQIREIIFLRKFSVFCRKCYLEIKLNQG